MEPSRFDKISDLTEDAGEAIFNLYKNDLFTDVTLTCNPGNVNFRAHKLILAFFSPVFSERFYRKGKPFCEKLYFESRTSTGVKNMVCYCYGELLEFENIIHIEETIKIAEEYEIVELLNISIKEIDKVEVDESNVLKVLEMSTKYGNEHKELECLDFINRNREAVFGSALFKNMEFERACAIFEKLRKLDFLTEVDYLNSALRWIIRDRVENKEKLMKKVDFSKLSVDEFIDIIISFPKFLTGFEISDAFKVIKSVTKTEQKSTGSTKEENEISTEAKTNDVCPDGPSEEQETEEIPRISEEKRNLLISILEEAGGKLAIVTIEENIGRRSLRVAITGDLNDGLLASLSQTVGDHTFDDVNITYDGIYYMLAILNNQELELSAVNYIEALKAAVYFQLQKIQDACLMKVGNVDDYDPLFLDGLREFPFFEERLYDILVQNTRDIVLHPKFVHCSHELIKMLLKSPSVHLPSELQLLIVTITWLEAWNRLRWNHRLSLLNEIAFEFISHADLVYISEHYPNFFTDNEINTIFLYKLENSSENKDNLPEWYNFKSRDLTASA